MGEKLKFTGFLAGETDSPIFVGDTVKSLNTGYTGIVVDVGGEYLVMLADVWNVTCKLTDGNWEILNAHTGAEAGEMNSPIFVEGIV